MSNSRNINVAIIGDHFMRPSFFIDALEKIDGAKLNLRTMQQDWPDTNLTHGYADNLPDELQGLREFLGEPDEIAEFIGDAEILIDHLAPITASMLARLPNLKLIAVSRGGPVNINKQAAQDNGVSVVNTPGRNASAVAEFTIGMILAQTRLLTIGHTTLAAGEWRGDLYRADRTGDELCNMTVGIIGYGHIGTKVVKLLKPFGCRILVSDPYMQISQEDTDAGVKQCNFDDLLEQSDVVSLHARVSKKTTQFLAAPQFAKMKNSAYFINTARGPMVNYDDLYEALRTRKLRGAGLETFAIEPAPADWPLLKLDNVSLTPHIAGASLQTVKYAAGLIADEVQRYINGQPFLNPC